MQKGKDAVFGTGNYLNPGAKYVLEVTGVKAFKGYKSDTTGVIEFKVLEVTNTETKEAYDKLGKFPNQPGSSVSISKDLKDKYKCGLFLAALQEIAHCTSDDLVEEVKGADGKLTGELMFHTLMQIGDSKVPSPLVGIRVSCETFDKPRDGKKSVTKEIWRRMPVPEGHPLAKALNAA